MGRLQWGRSGGDGALSALVIGGIAMALGGAALFGMVAHTWTPFLPQKGAGASPFDSVARGDAAPPVKTTELIPRRSRFSSFGFASRSEDLTLADSGLAGPSPPAAPSTVTHPSVPAESLAHHESVVAHAAEAPQVAAPAVARRVETVLLEPEPKPAYAAVALAEPPAIEMRALEPQAPEARPVIVRVADVKVVGSTEIRVVQTRPVQKAAEAKPATPKVAEAKPAPPRAPEARPAPVIKVAEARPVAPKAPDPRPVPQKVAESKPGSSKAVEPKPAPVKLAETKPAPVKAAEARPAPAVKVAEARPAPPVKIPEARPVPVKAAAPKPVEARTAPVKVVDSRPAPARLAEPRRVEMRPVGMKVAAVKPSEPARAEVKRAVETKAPEPKRIEPRRAPDMKNVEARFAETKRALEMKEAEVKLAEMRHAAELKAAEARLADSQRAFETQAAEAKLAETKRAVESTLAEAKLAEARLAETKRAFERSLAQARAPEVKPAVESRPTIPRSAPALPRYEWCESCGTVSSVVNRQRDRGNNWEVRVHFEDGNDRVFLFPTDPGLYSGERVRLEAGRLIRQYPRRSASYSPA